MTKSRLHNYWSILLNFGMQVRDVFPEIASRLKPIMTDGTGCLSGNAALIAIFSS